MNDIEERVIASLQGTLRFLCYKSVERWSRVCESPIETLLVASIDIATDLIDQSLYCVTQDLETPKRFLFFPQFEWRSKRIDLALLKEKQPILFIECDGHDFHERTRDQAQRDRSRDREIQEAGIKVFRFTGSEIYRDVFSCVNQIFTEVMKHADG